MNALPRATFNFGEGTTLVPRLQPVQERRGTKRAVELEAKVARLQVQLQNAQEELEQEQNRLPEIGDFVRCPLTNFFGQVTKIIPRSYGRPWVEILPYLSKDLPGHSTIDLFDSWELMDPPTDQDEAIL